MARRTRWGRFRPRLGFTLTEMLVVIAIIGVLAGLLIPAVQYARETARKATCSNNLRQIGMAFQTHNTQFEYFPTAGSVTPSPRRTGSNGAPKNAKSQSWGWAYQILPYIEQQNAYKETDLNAASMVVSSYFCPSRRKPLALPSVDWGINGDRGQLDYAGCAGFANPAFPDPANLLQKQDGAVTPHIWFNSTTGRDELFDTNWVGLGNIPDGASGTLLVGERNWNFARRDDTSQLDEDNGYIAGYDWDTIRWGYLPPAPDRDDPASDGDTRFGSAHSGVCIVVFADGAVHQVTFEVDPLVFQRACGRRDGTAVDPGQL